MSNDNQNPLPPLQLPTNEEESLAFSFIQCSCAPNRATHADPHTEQCLVNARGRLHQAEQIVRSQGDEDILATSQVIPAPPRAHNGPIIFPIPLVNHYHDALYELANMLFVTGKQRHDEAESKLLLEESMSYFLAYKGRSQGRGDLDDAKISFILLHLERFDDLCAFVDFTFRDGEPVTDEQRVELQAGHFPFAINKDPTHYNVVAEFGEAIFRTEDSRIIPLLLAILFMKQHLQAARQDFSENVNVFIETDWGITIKQISLVLHELATGTNEFKQEQKAQVRQLIRLIHNRNVSILPALIHPEPLQQEIDETGSMEDIGFFSRCPAEAIVNFEICRDIFPRMRGVRQVLVESFGESPRYHSSPFDFRPDEVRLDFDPFMIPGLADVPMEEGED